MLPRLSHRMEAWPQPKSASGGHVERHPRKDLKFPWDGEPEAWSLYNTTPPALREEKGVPIATAAQQSMARESQLRVLMFDLKTVPCSCSRLYSDFGPRDTSKGQQ